MNKLCYLIINPNRFPQYVKILKKIVKKYKYIKVIESKSSEHFIKSIDDFYNSKNSYLLIWGGDGTAHATINRLTQLKLENSQDSIKRCLGFLRGGSGNGIQDSYEVPYNIFNQLKTYINSINNDYTIDVDLIKAEFNGKTEYTQLSGLGIDAKILKLRNKDKFKTGPLKGLIKPGLWNYITAAIRTFIKDYDKDLKEYHLKLYYGRYLFKGRSVNAEVKIDYLERNCQPLIIEVGNRPFFAARLRVCPHVVCNNGLMNLYIYNKISRRTILRNIWNFWSGRHYLINDRFAKKKKPIIEHFELKSCQISSHEPFYFHMDGDLKKVRQAVNGKYNLDFSILPQSITFLVPEVFYNKFHPPGIK